MNTTLNLPVDIINTLVQTNAPLQQIEFYGHHIGTEKDGFPKNLGGTFTTGDIIVTHEGTKWIRLFEELHFSKFADHYIAFYMTYDNCTKYGFITEESPKVARFNKEFKQRLTAAESQEDYLTLISWVSQETKGNAQMYQSADKYKEIAKRNRHSLSAYIEANQNPVENFLLTKIQKELNYVH